jgi:tRNA modification GTPase
MTSETIFSPITSIYNSSVISVRISGANALECLASLKVDIATIKPNIVKLKKIFDPKTEKLIDNCLVSFFQAPHSFTGEDVIELSLHGSTYIFNKIVKIFSEIPNVRLAQAGEFSQQAFYNGKMDLVEAEALSDLISSKTFTQHEQALKNLAGNLSNLYQKWRVDLIAIAANIEALIDFPDEDIPQDLSCKIENDILSLKQAIKQHVANDNGRKINDGIYLSIIGPPNVGKSSLLNFLAKNNIAITSDIAGTTRDVVSFSLDIEGVEVKIFDTAGIRQTEDKIENLGIKKSFEQHQNCDINIIMFDCDSDIQDFLQKYQIKVRQNSIIIINKCDIGSKKDNHEFLNISIKENTHLEELMMKIKNKVKKLSNISNSPALTRQRYSYHLKSVIEILENFSFDQEIELIAEDLRYACNEIGKITGSINIEEILDNIFSNFCIGK